MSMVIELSYTTIAIFLSVLGALYFYLNRNFDYWSSRGVNGPKPRLIFGNILSFFNKTFAEFNEENLKKYGNIHGLFVGSKPMLVVAEPQLIKDILVKDFEKFVNRLESKIDDPVLGRMLHLETNDDWKRLRSLISPTFSSRKMKKMHNLVEECVQPLYKYLENVAQNEREIELRKLMGDYTTDVIASCAFATKTDTHNDPNNPFVKNVRKALAQQNLRFFLLAALKPLMKFLDIQIYPRDCVDLFRNCVKEISRKREENKSGKHNNFIELMLNTKNRGKSDDTDVSNNLEHFEPHNSIEYNSESIDYAPLIDDEVMNNTIMFYTAGHDKINNLVSHLIYYLAINPESQRTLFEEISHCIDENGGLDYESISRLPYLDACVSETLRLNNTLTQAVRVASENYTLGQTGITIPKGMTINIPIHAIHNSSKYYPNPSSFDPTRFMPENIDKIIPYTYLPFGAGPRNCVGLRFALMGAKTVIAKLITKFKFFQTENTKIPLKYTKFNPHLTPSEMKVGVEFRDPQNF